MVIAVCEDERLELDRNCDLISEVAERYKKKYTLLTYQSGEELLLSTAKEHIDILFSDIYMKEVTGMQAAVELRKCQKKVEIVFITTSMDHLLDSYEIDAAHYIIKPVTMEKIEKALMRCIQRLGKEEIFLEFKVKKTKVKILEKSIRYIESMGNTTLFHTETGEIKVYQTLKDVEANLSEDIFLKVQRGIIINMKYIKLLKSDECLLNNGMIFKLSRKGKSMIRQKYIEYQFECAKKWSD